MKTEIQETELYKAFIKALDIHDMRSDDNPFVVKCCEIAEEYASQSSPVTKETEEMIKIPKWQMVHIEDTLRMANNIHHSSLKETCFDRCVCKAWNWSKNALGIVDSPAKPK